MSLRHTVVITAGCLALAVAIWLFPASVHVVDWPASGPSRVALFAPRARLVWLLAAALVTSGLALAWGRARQSLPLFAGIATQACLLWLWAVPYLPWLPDRLPLLLFLAGPVRWIVAGGAAVAAVRCMGRTEVLRYFIGGTEVPPCAPGGTRVPPYFRIVIFAAGLILYAGLGLMNARSVGPGGDEPHYLMIAQSLLADGDLKIENNHQRREYRAFWGGELRPDYMKRGIDGEIYSIHAPGLPVFLLPAYAVAGYPGTVLVLCLIAALTALAIFDLAEALAGTRVAVATWLAACLTVPFVPHSWLIFPEMPGALVVAWAALWVWRPAEQSAATWLWRGIALATLPWLHTKFVIFVALFGAALVWRARKQPKTLTVLLTPVAVSLVSWLGFFYAFYGTINPEAPYGDYTKLYVLAQNIPRGLFGLMFDQKFGLLFYSPVYLFAITGCWIMLRRADTRLLGAVLLLVTAVHVGSTTRLYMWWGGTSAPARFLVPILPCFAPMLALGIGALRGRVARTVFASCLIVSLLVAAVGAGWPDRLWLFSDSRGYARLLETLQSGAPLTFSLPTFTYENWLTPIRTLLPWLLAAGFGLGAMAAAARWLRPSGAWLAAVGALTMLVTAGAAAGRIDVGAREEMARRGALDLLWRYNGEKGRAFEYATFGKVDDPRLRAAAGIRVRGYPFPAIALPQGAYEARVMFSGAMQRQGEAAVTSAGRVTFARSAGALGNPAIVPFELPVSASRITVAVSDQTLAASVAGVEIVPTVLVPVHAREPRPARRIEEVPERPGAFLIYVDGNAFPENGVFWTRGVERSEVLLAPGPYARLRLTLHLGPRTGAVTVSVAGNPQTASVEANGSAEVQLDVPHGLRLIPLVIQSPTSFRPSDVDASSDDARLLGCQVRVSVD